MPEWIEWDGKGEPPVQPGTLHDRRFRDGGEGHGYTSRAYDGQGFRWRKVWQHVGDACDIVAYRVWS